MTHKLLFSHARAVLADGLARQAFPAAVCEVGTAAGPLWTEASGRLTYAEDSLIASPATSFDLASLTKVIATTSLVMRLVHEQRCNLNSRVADVFPAWCDTDRAGITIGHLLDHSSGLPAQLHLAPSDTPKESALETILLTPLARPVGASSVYSDVGFILLGFFLERVTGQTMDAQWDALWATRPDALASAADISYNPSPARRHQIAPTEFIPARGGLIQGTVHDDNAALLGGVAAHAGLFGTASAVGSFAQWVLHSFHEPTWLASPELMRTFARRRDIPGSSRALGWDTMLPTSSCGSRMSGSAIGHTGFTGTSLWIDWERDLYVVLLTNRVHPTRENERFLPCRSRFHDAVLTDLG